MQQIKKKLKKNAKKSTKQLECRTPEKKNVKVDKFEPYESVTNPN